MTGWEGSREQVRWEGEENGVLNSQECRLQSEDTGSSGQQPLASGVLQPDGNRLSVNTRWRFPVEYFSPPLMATADLTGFPLDFPGSSRCPRVVYPQEKDSYHSQNTSGC